MERNTEREYKVWVEFFAAEWDDPDKHDWYLMQLASVLFNVNGKDKQPADMKLRFKQVSSKPERSEAAQAVDVGNGVRIPGPITRKQLVRMQVAERLQERGML